MPPARYQRVDFGEVPGWVEDDHAAAFAAFQLSLQALTTGPQRNLITAGLQSAALLAASDTSTARTFFERNFAPHRVLHDESNGFLTAYYEPILRGARTSSPEFSVPLHLRPADLVNLVDETDRAAALGPLSHARKVGDSIEPYPTRQDIDQGALAGQDLEAFFVTDEVERFFLQVQGSGIIELPEGNQIRVTYDGKNGHPYTSIGRFLVESGTFTSEQMSLATLAVWLRADNARGRETIWRNKSYVFFRELPGATAPIGALGVPLTPFRSLAIDPAFHALGLPVFVDAPAITHMTGAPFRHLMVGQDVGSAIRGAERGDIFAGSGTEAGRLAGTTKHAGQFFVLLPHASQT